MRNQENQLKSSDITLIFARNRGGLAFTVLLRSYLKTRF